MQFLTIALLAALLHFSSPILATPVNTFASLAPRSQFCANAHSTVAGTIMTLPNSKFDRRTSSADSLHARAPRIIWCVERTETYIHLAIKAVRTAQVITSVMAPVSDAVLKHLYSKPGDGPIQQGFFEMHAGDMVFMALNAGNHQLTWGVLKAAIDGLNDYFTVTGDWGDAEFDIYDGDNQVGQGILSGPW